MRMPPNLNRYRQTQFRIGYALTRSNLPALKRLGLKLVMGTIAVAYRRKPAPLTRVKRAVRRRWFTLTETRAARRVARSWVALTDTAHAIKPYRWVAVIEYGQGYGGAEEGGWWFDTWEPSQVRRVAVWNTDAAVTHLERTGEPVQGRYRFMPSPADTDPMHDYDDAVDLVGASYGPDRVAVRASTRRPVSGNNWSRWE